MLLFRCQQRNLQTGLLITTLIVYVHVQLVHVPALVCHVLAPVQVEE
jgi:hypothetical protein